MLQSPHIDRATKFASVAGFGVRGPFGPRGGISSGPRPGSSSGRGDSPGSRTGGAISGCGLPGGISGGGSLGVPGVAGGISGGSIGIVHHRQFVARRTTTFSMRRCSALRDDRSGLFRRVTNGLDIVAVGIEHERSIVCGMIMRTNAGWSVVTPAGGDCRLVERIHRGAVLGENCDM
jgi:hypothetical protein